jgi:hypothetical protein
MNWSTLDAKRLSLIKAVVREHTRAALRVQVSDDVTRLRACALLGQVSTFYANRENTLAAMNWSTLDAKRLSLIKAVVREHTRAALRVQVNRPSSRQAKAPLLVREQTLRSAI